VCPFSAYTQENATLKLLRKETIEKLERMSTDWMINEKSQLRDELSTFIKTSLNVNIRYKT
jgi:hypothetical protein